MPRVKWDEDGKRTYETGTDQGVVYPWDSTLNSGTGGYGKGFGWNGLTAVSLSPSGADETALYADNIKYLSLRAVEELGATIEAYGCPTAFEECDGTASIGTGVTIGQQTRKRFAFTFRTIMGNDTESNDYGYKIHILYGCTASPSEKSYATVNESPDAITFSWELSTVPVKVTGFKPTSYICIDSTKVAAAKLKALEDILYGTDPDAEAQTEGTEPRVPMPAEIITLLASA